ncbi:hypothetical protein [Mycolicibacter icosiumassiliensis]|uniref:hypothetical protein n=1 Tax=Mycolicibacter icosiumassiliensis TaxID=1792835 RepID=UPI001F296FFB|nr:hypothetical protein [Mycolicibacter icosiumassiliensis]
MQLRHFGDEFPTLCFGVSGPLRELILQPHDLGGESFAVGPSLTPGHIEGFSAVAQNFDFMVEAPEVISDVIAIETAKLSFEFRNIQHRRLTPSPDKTWSSAGRYPASGRTKSLMKASRLLHESRRATNRSRRGWSCHR